jgi:ribonuclease HI
VDHVAKPIGRATNDIAEYTALIEGLRLAHHHEVKRPRAYLDCDFIVEQMNRRAEVHQADLQPLFVEAMALAAPLDLRIAWIPRPWNLEADDLAGKLIGG